jgi:hypothetical protein
MQVRNWFFYLKILKLWTKFDTQAYCHHRLVFLDWVDTFVEHAPELLLIEVWVHTNMMIPRTMRNLETSLELWTQNFENYFRVFFRNFNNGCWVLIKWLRLIIVTTDLVIYALRSRSIFVDCRKSGSSWQVLTLFACFSECITPILKLRYAMESRESQL